MTSITPRKSDCSIVNKIILVDHYFGAQTLLSATRLSNFLLFCFIVDSFQVIEDTENDKLCALTVI